MDVSRLNGRLRACISASAGPRINAGGRIGRADLGVRLLLGATFRTAARIAAELDREHRTPVIEQMGGEKAEEEGEGLARARGQGRRDSHGRRAGTRGRSALSPRA